MTLLLWQLASDSITLNAKLRVHLGLETAQSAQEAGLTLHSGMSDISPTGRRHTRMVPNFLLRHRGRALRVLRGAGKGDRQERALHSLHNGWQLGFNGMRNRPPRHDLARPAANSEWQIGRCRVLLSRKRLKALLYPTLILNKLFSARLRPTADILAPPALVAIRPASFQNMDCR